jgi:hypothetical protein
MKSRDFIFLLSLSISVGTGCVISAGASIVSGRTDIVLTGIGILAGIRIIFAGTGCIVSVCVIHFYFLLILVV